MNEGSSERTSTPQDERSANGFLAPEASDGQDPRKFKYNSADARQGVDVAKLSVNETDVSVEPKDSSVSKLIIY